MDEQEFTRRINEIRELASSLITNVRRFEWAKTSAGILVQVDAQTGEPVTDQDGYYFACSQGDNPDTCGDALRLYVPVEPWVPEESDDDEALKRSWESEPADEG